MKFPLATPVKPYRSQRDGLVDLLQYASGPDDGIVQLKYGAYLASWVYRGEDNASATPQFREYVSAQINAVLSKLGSGWMLHVDAIRYSADKYPSADASFFPDPVTAAIDQERRLTFEQLGTLYEGAFLMTLTYQPPLQVETKFVDMMFEDSSGTRTAEEISNRQLEEFKHRIQDIESRLSTVLKMERLRSHAEEEEDGSLTTYDDLLAYLQFCITGVKQPFQLPPCAMYLDSLLAGQEFWTGVVPRIGDKFIQVVAITGFPSSSSPGILADLAQLPCEYRWSTRFIFTDPHEADSHFEKLRRKWRQKVRGFVDQVMGTQKGAINEDAQTMMNEASAAKAEISSGAVGYGFYTSVIVLMHEDRTVLDELARKLTKSIAMRGFGSRVETLNTVEAWLGSLPGHGVENVRRPMIHTLNLADLLPTSSIWAGQSHAPCPFYKEGSPALMQCATTGNTPFWLNLHVQDLGHTLLFGPPGAGKSTLLCIIAAQFNRYPGASIYCFDKGNSMYALCKAVGGSHFTVAGEGDSLNFSPLQFLETAQDRAWAAEWINDTCALQGVITTPNQRIEIARSITSMAENGTTGLTEFVSTVQDQGIRDALQPYTVDGAMGQLLDAMQDGLRLSRFTVFEIEELMRLGDKFVLPVLAYLFRRIEKSLQGQPAMIILDEAWLMLAHPAFKAKIEEWLRVLRKANCVVVMATQSLTDAVKSGLLDVLKETTATKIYLPNYEARDEVTAAVYRGLGLNARQIEIVSSATPKREYYYVSKLGRRLFDLAMGPLALAFTAVSDKETLAAVKQCEAEHGADWPRVWLAQRGINLSEYVS